MGFYLVTNEDLSDGSHSWQYFSTDDYQMGVIHKHWNKWKRMFLFYHPYAYIFATEAEARDVMRCIGNFAPPLRHKMQVLPKDYVDRILIQKVLGIDA